MQNISINFIKMQKINEMKTFKNGDECMIKKIAWDTFKNTGDINTFLEYKEIEKLEKGIQNIDNVAQETQEIIDLNEQNIQDIKNDIQL